MFYCSLLKRQTAYAEMSAAAVATSAVPKGPTATSANAPSSKGLQGVFRCVCMCVCVCVCVCVRTCTLRVRRCVASLRRVVVAYSLCCVRACVFGSCVSTRRRLLSVRAGLARRSDKEKEKDVRRSNISAGRGACCDVRVCLAAWRGFLCSANHARRRSSCVHARCCVLLRRTRTCALVMLSVCSGCVGCAHESRAARHGQNGAFLILCELDAAR